MRAHLARLSLILVLLPLLFSGCQATNQAATQATAQATKTLLSPREQMRAIKNYMVYYGAGRVADLARYDLAIVQPDTLTDAELETLKEKGTLVVAYLSVGEVEPNRSWYTDGRADPRWILGKNENWGSYFIDAGQAGWQKLMAELTGEFLNKGFQGVFLDTVDTVDVYPETRSGMVELVHGLRRSYPDALLVQNRGMSIAGEVASDLDGLMFEDVSTTYDFEKKEYQYRENSTEIDSMKEFKQRTGLPVLGLDYAPPDNPGMAKQAVKKSLANGFIPCVSTIDLDDIPDYRLDGPEVPDVRIASIRAEGDETQVTLVVKIQNVGLDNAVDVPVSLKVGEKELGSIKATLEPGDNYDWMLSWPNPLENTVISVSAPVSNDPAPANNQLQWTFTYASIAMEPLLPYDQQKHRPAGNGPEMTASFFAAPPVIDADLAEWSGLPCTNVNTREQISFGEAAQWSGPEDLSGEVCYGWDKQNLYVAFNVRDDVHVQKYSGGNLWKGDHVEMWFDSQLQLDFDAAGDSQDDFQVGVSAGDGDAVPADFFIFTPTVPAEQYAGEVEWKVLQSKDGYRAEMRIPAKILKGLRLAAGQTIGATFEPSDTDTPGGSEQELMMSSAPQSSTNWGNPTLWNNLTFKE